MEYVSIRQSDSIVVLFSRQLSRSSELLSLGGQTRRGRAAMEGGLQRERKRSKVESDMKQPQYLGFPTRTAPGQAQVKRKVLASTGGSNNRVPVRTFSTELSIKRA